MKNYQDLIKTDNGVHNAIKELALKAKSLTMQLMRLEHRIDSGQELLNYTNDYLENNLWFYSVNSYVMIGKVCTMPSWQYTDSAEQAYNTIVDSLTEFIENVEYDIERLKQGYVIVLN